MTYALLGGLVATGFGKAVMMDSALAPYAALRTELLARVRQLDKVSSRSGPSEQKRLRVIKSENQQWLKRVIDRVGYPTQLMVGFSATRAAHRVVSMSGDPAIQNLALRAMREAIRALRATPMEYACLVDQIRVGRGQLQAYGTLNDHPWPSLNVVLSNRKVIGISAKAKPSGPVLPKALPASLRPSAVE
jgi:hypothetical protein